MTLTNYKLGLSISIASKLIGFLIEKSKLHYPNEFGGFLVGFYSNDNKHLFITDNILPTKYHSQRYSFTRETDGTDQILKRFYQSAPSQYYVGEWHSHPDSAPVPSLIDESTMSKIANNKDVAIKNPVLLIVGKNNEIGIYVLLESKLHKYE